MKVFFYTSTSGSAFLKALICDLHAAGIDVRKVAAVETATFRRSKGRLWGPLFRIWMNLYIGLKVIYGLLVNRNAIHVLTTNPFYLPFLGGILARGKNCVTVQLLYDLYPDVLENSGVIRRNGNLANALARTTTIALRKCHGTVFLGYRLKGYAEEKYWRPRTSAVIPVGAAGDLFRGREELLHNIGSKVNFIYCGNLGRMHDVDTLEKGIRLLIDNGETGFMHARFTFYASGHGYVRLRGNLNRLCNNYQIHFGESIADDREWADIMKSADVSLVTLADGAEDLVMPSKVYSAMVAGHAIIAVCSEESDLARLIRLWDCGWIVCPGDANGFATIVSRIISDRNELFRRRRNAYNAGHSHFDTKKVGEMWMEFFRRF